MTLSMALTLAAIAVVLLFTIAFARCEAERARRTLTRFDFEKRGREKARDAWRKAA